MRVSFRSPIAFRVQTLPTNHHGPDETSLRSQWRCYRLVRGVRIYRYLQFGDSVSFDFQLRHHWWKVLSITI